MLENRLQVNISTVTLHIAYSTANATVANTTLLLDIRVSVLAVIASRVVCRLPPAEWKGGGCTRTLDETRMYVDSFSRCV